MTQDLTATQLQAVGFLESLAADRHMPMSHVLSDLDDRALLSGRRYRDTWHMTALEWAPVVRAVQKWDEHRPTSAKQGVPW